MASARLSSLFALVALIACLLLVGQTIFLALGGIALVVEWPLGLRIAFGLSYFINIILILVFFGVRLLRANVSEQEQRRLLDVE